MGMRRIVLPLLVIALAACQGSIDPELQQAQGAWDWIESSGSIAGRTFTPESEGYTLRLEFDGNRVRAFRNDSLVGTSEVSFVGDKITYSPALPAFVFSGLAEPQTITLVGDTIVLTDPCCDLYVHRFVKR